MATTFTDIHPDIIQTHVLPRLDGPSLSSTATASSYLQTLCTDENLWSHICNSTWPSITDPRVDDIISTFPAGHRSFFQDSFPALVTDVNHHNHRHLDVSSQPWPSQIISAVDLRFQNDVMYSKVEFTDITVDFLSSALRIKLHNDPESNHGSGIFQSIDLKVDELSGTDEATLSHLIESLSLNWILIDPTMKRAGNLSSIKPVGVSKGWWMTNETRLLYATVLPGCDKNKLVQCRIQVVLGVGAGSVGLHVKEVMLELMDLDFCHLKGSEFLVITQAALSEENNVRRKMVDDEESRRRYREFKNISINSLSDLQNEIQSKNQELRSTMVRPCHSVLQRVFHSMKAQIQCTIPHQKAFDFVYCIILAVPLLWLLDLFPSI